MYGPSWPPVKVRVTLAFDPGALVAFRYLTRVLQRLLGDENGFEPSSASSFSWENPLGRSLSSSSALVSSSAVRVTGTVDVGSGALGVELGAGVLTGVPPSFLSSSPPQAVSDSVRAAASASGNDTYLVIGIRTLGGGQQRI